MVSFQTVTSALLWCFTVQLQLLTQDWPKEILETDEGRPLLDFNGNSIARGLSVRMWVTISRNIQLTWPKGYTRRISSL